MTLIYEPRTLLFEVIQPIDVILPSEMDDVHIETVQKGEKNPRIILLGRFSMANIRFGRTFKLV